MAAEWLRQPGYLLAGPLQERSANSRPDRFLRFIGKRTLDHTGYIMPYRLYDASKTTQLELVATDRKRHSACSSHLPNQRLSLLLTRPLCAIFTPDSHSHLGAPSQHSQTITTQMLPHSFSNAPATSEPSRGCPPGVEEEGCLTQCLVLQVGQK